MKTFNTTEIKKYLQSQTDLKSAIKNIENINSTKKRITYKGKTVLYIPNDVKSKGKLKEAIVEYMLESGHEMTGYEMDIPLEGLLQMLEYKIE